MLSAIIGGGGIGFGVSIVLLLIAPSFIMKITGAGKADGFNGLTNIFFYVLGSIFFGAVVAGSCIAEREFSKKRDRKRPSQNKRLDSKGLSVWRRNWNLGDP